MIKRTISDIDLIAIAKGEAEISIHQFDEYCERLLCQSIKDMSFAEQRAIQILGDSDLGISGLISLYLGHNSE